MFKRTPEKQRKKIRSGMAAAALLGVAGWWYGFDPGFYVPVAGAVLVYTGLHWMRLREMA